MNLLEERLTSGKTTEGEAGDRWRAGEAVGSGCRLEGWTSAGNACRVAVARLLRLGPTTLFPPDNLSLGIGPA
jgi:hypothetical protein